MGERALMIVQQRNARIAEKEAAAGHPSPRGSVPRQKPVAPEGHSSEIRRRSGPPHQTPMGLRTPIGRRTSQSGEEHDRRRGEGEEDILDSRGPYQRGMPSKGEERTSNGTVSSSQENSLIHEGGGETADESIFLQVLRLLQLDHVEDVTALHFVGVRNTRDLLSLEVSDVDHEDMKMMPLLSRKKLYKFVSSSLHDKQKLISTIHKSPPEIEMLQTELNVRLATARPSTVRISQMTSPSTSSADRMTGSWRAMPAGWTISAGGKEERDMLRVIRNEMESEEERHLASHKVLLRMEKIEFKMEKLQRKMTLDMEDMTSKMSKALDSLNSFLVHEVNARQTNLAGEGR